MWQPRHAVRSNAAAANQPEMTRAAPRRARFGRVLVSLWLASLGAACVPRPPALVSPERTPAGVVFRYSDPAAAVVQVAGSWETNLQLRGRDWTSDRRVGLMERDPDGVWELEVPLGPGRYEYLFLVDGRFWHLDAANPQRAADGQGGFVSLLVVP